MSTNRKNTKEEPKNSSLFSLIELCNELSISTATGRNWMKQNRLQPTKYIRKSPFFSATYIATLKNELKRNGSLKSRRNKTFISGYGIYDDYLPADSKNKKPILNLLSYLDEKQIIITETELKLLLAECAIQLICQAQSFTNNLNNNLLLSFLKKQTHHTSKDTSFPGDYAFLITDLLQTVSTDTEKTLAFIHRYPELFQVRYHYKKEEDILGFLYLSLRNLGARKATGAYYTPTTTVEKLISNLLKTHSDFEQKNILDPCCGTGNFLLQLPKNCSIEKVYGNDIDAISVAITRINMALKYQVTDRELLYSHFTVSDYFSWQSDVTFDCILGNPPWGSSFAPEEKIMLQQRFTCVQKNPESYDLAIEQAISHLSCDGILSFVLPEAILHVRSHKKIRELLLNTCRIEVIEYLGNVFHKVQCPSILLQLKRTDKGFTTRGLWVKERKRQFKIKTNRTTNVEYFNFTTTDKEYKLLQKLLHVSPQTTLRGQADFALGIVTGNNAAYLSHKKNDQNEIILKGLDLRKFRTQPSKQFITFAPKHFQQTAPECFYRAPEKLLYRFICKQLVFAYDDTQALTLNSCNIVIPHIENLDIKYILGILNSRITQFIYQKEFSSIKVLRSHLEQLPIPMVAKNQQEQVIELVNLLLTATNDRELLSTYNTLDELVADLFGLNEKEYEIILSSQEGQNLFI